MNKVVLFFMLTNFKVFYSRFIEGDILVHEEKDLESDLDIAGGVKLADPSKLWPGGFVYYRFDRTFRSAQHQTHVESMMRYIESKVDGCITFEKSDTKVDFVLITADGGDKGSGTSCFSDLGRIGGKQILNLDISCLRNHTIVHELMHTLGFSHEHNRPDRDLYVTVFTENILESKKGNFRRRESGNSKWFEPGDVDTLNTPFDFMSVLLYPPYTSSSKSVSKNGKKTLEYKDPIIPSWPNIPQNEEPLSIIDTVELGLAYTCQLEQDTLIQYVHYNRLSSSQKISNLEAKLVELEESSSKEIGNLETKLDQKLDESTSKINSNLETKLDQLEKTIHSLVKHTGFSEGFVFEENSRSYRIFVDEYLAWDNANEKCKKMGARLPVLSDVKTIQIVKKYLDNADFENFEQWDRSSRRVWLGLKYHSSSGLTWVDGQRVIGYPASSRLFVWESRRVLSQEVSYADDERNYGFYIDGDIAKLPGGGRQGAAVLCELMPYPED